jgi:hypothetical protein
MVVATSALLFVMPSAESRPATADPLIGTWVTGAVPTAKIQAALKAAGFSQSEIGRFVANHHITTAWSSRLDFYPQGSMPFVLRTSWNPLTSKFDPSNGDHGPYKLLPGNEFEWRGTDPPTDTYAATYAYAVHGNRLTLRFVKLVEPGLPAKQVRADERILVVYSAAPFTKTHT